MYICPHFGVFYSDIEWHVTHVQVGEVEWEGREGVRVGGTVKEREGSLRLEGFVGEKLVSANIAIVNDSLHIFTQVNMMMM